MAKQRAQEVTARLTAASTLADAKRPRVENGSSDFDNEKALVLLHLALSSSSCSFSTYNFFYSSHLSYVFLLIVSVD
ncbi:hypothetical protein SLEP1_g49275 [Rubroshorea leprosula]|uniref:Uncharacterized protein n=1 Tax=Rubroshorea leprosula TaxID=152421 RepID=A0AAV5LWC3_9ROSI|nr:hypothetical protein SLEP1_g49275 [Rubroshorea leprosula]